MISHEHKCIFIHIPKCAGTSIEKALGHMIGEPDRGWQDHRSLRLIEKPLITPYVFNSIENLREAVYRIRNNNRTTEYDRNRYTVTKQQYDSYYKFSFVRNPWARAFSAFRNIMRDERHRIHYGITEDLEFSGFLRRFIGTGMLRSQLFWLKNFRGSMPFDFIGRFENLERDFGCVLEDLGLDDITLPHTLAGEAADYREHYDGDSRERVRDYYQEEIAAFEYTFDS